jgi:hypothetical protein
VSCGIVNITAELFNGPMNPAPAELLKEVTTDHFGKSLQSADLTAVWGFATLLAREFASLAEYQDAVLSMPELVLGARGARCTFARTIISSPEFQQSDCAQQRACANTRLAEFVCLNSNVCMDLASQIFGGNIITAGDPNATALAMCDAADSLSLFGNAALMDASWCIGC